MFTTLSLTLRLNQLGMALCYLICMLTCMLSYDHAEFVI